MHWSPRQRSGDEEDDDDETDDVDDDDYDDVTENRRRDVITDSDTDSVTCCLLGTIHTIFVLSYRKVYGCVLYWYRKSVIYT